MNKEMIKALLVDDEDRARVSVKKLLSRFCPQVEIIGEASNVQEAIEQIRLHRPHLVFLDIEMPERSGFALIHAFEKVNFHVIFTTAYHQYAIRAFEVSAIDYLLKPIDTERLKEAVRKTIEHRSQQEYSRRLEVLESNMKNYKLKKLSIPDKGDYIVISIQDIITIKASGVYSVISVSDDTSNNKHTCTRKLRYFEELFERIPNLIRVHRSWIINMHHIASYSKKNYRITLKNGIHIPLGRSYKTAFEELVNF